LLLSACGPAEGSDRNAGNSTDASSTETPDDGETAADAGLGPSDSGGCAPGSGDCLDGGTAGSDGGPEPDSGDDTGELGIQMDAAEPPSGFRCGVQGTRAFSLSTENMRTSFSCPEEEWCARMGNFIPANTSPPLYRNDGTYGGRTGYGAPGSRQRGLSMDPSIQSVTIQGGSNVGWYYNTATVPGTEVTYEHGVWDDRTANLATGYRLASPIEVFPENGDGFARLQFRYLIQTSNHAAGHPGCRLGGWLTFRDFSDPTLTPRERPLIWIGVKPFDATNPDSTVGFTDGATRTPAFIFRQAIGVNTTDPSKSDYYRAYLARDDEHYGPFVQFDPMVPTDREFVTQADGTWRT
ncbi:MAG: hypothetical protein R3324_20520, partial [Halobacteriales archaeon]|nr:hypothetical protein [Halobacteriales archaeon]